MTENTLTKWTACNDRGAGDIFTELLIVPTGETQCPSALRSQYIHHNVAIGDQAKRRVGAMNGARQSESAIIALVVGIDEFASTITEPDYYTAQIIGHLLDGFNDALNLDLGRLDGAALSAWACRLAERFGIAQ